MPAPSLFKLCISALKEELLSPIAKKIVANINYENLVIMLQHAFAVEVAHLPIEGQLVYRDWTTKDVIDTTTDAIDCSVRLEDSGDGGFMIRVDHTKLAGFWLQIHVPSESALCYPGLLLQCEGRISGLDIEAPTHQCFPPLYLPNRFLGRPHTKATAVVGEDSIIKVSSDNPGFWLDITVAQERLQQWREHCETE